MNKRFKPGDRVRERAFPNDPAGTIVRPAVAYTDGGDCSECGWIVDWDNGDAVPEPEDNLMLDTQET